MLLLQTNNRIWVLYLLVISWTVRNTIFIRQRSGFAYATVDPSAMIQIVIVIAILILLVTSSLTDLRRQIKDSSLKFYFAYLALAAASALWSVNPLYSLYRAVEVFVLSSAVLYFCTSASTVDETIKRVQFIVWPILFLTVLGTLRLTGPGLNLKNNSLGASAAMTASFFVVWILAGMAQKKLVRLIQTTAACILVLVSMSLASWWSFWFGFLYGALFTRRKILVFLILSLGGTLFITLGTDTRTSLLLRDKHIDSIQSMTGRKILWMIYMEASHERPLLGFGFATGARTIGKIYTTNTHNSFIAALLSVGWLGVGCLVLFTAALIRELIIFRHGLHPPWLACAGAIAAGALNSMSISIIGEQWNPAATVFLAFLGLHMFLMQQAKKERRGSTFLPKAPGISKSLNTVY